MEKYLKLYLTELLTEHPHILESPTPAKELTETFWQQALPLLQKVK